MNAARDFQNVIAQLHPRWYGLGIGLALGVIGGLVGFVLALGGPLVALIALGALLIGLYILTSLRVALYGAVAILLLLPFGTLPFRLGLTFTLLDVALLIFLLIYALQWMRRERRGFFVVWPQVFVLLYMAWLLFAFLLGLRYANPTSTDIRQFAAMLLSIGMVFILVDVLRETRDLRGLVLVIGACVVLQALLAIGLYLLPDVAAESLLVRLSRFGYPDGGVIRYIESNPALGERAIGTWVDPNALGSILAVGAAMLTPQLFATQPLLKRRWLSFGLFGLIALALLLTSSRASFLALGVGLFAIVLIRYRRYLPLLLLAGSLFLLLPQTQGYIDRILQALQGADLATQMRIGEWTDSLELIQQYPLTGIGFTGTPTIGLYTDVANMYLIMANTIGITGVVLFLLAMLMVFRYGYGAWRTVQGQAHEALHLGFHIGLMVALVNAVADLYYFRTDFQASITWFWLMLALCLASSRLAHQNAPLSA